MAIKDLFFGKKEEVELPVPEEETVTEKINVRIENLQGLIDVERLTKLLREGNILFLKTKELQKRDLGQLQTTVQRLKRVCMQNDWDIAGTEDGYLVLTPKFARIER
jgi:SepF-like predicted cell division protein (DUF552 family)